MSSSDEEITKLYRVRRTVMQMLNDRGYLVTDDEINMTKQQFIEHFGDNIISRDKLFMIKNKRNDTSDQIMVFFQPLKPRRATATLKKCIKRMHSEKIYKTIFVSEHGVTDEAKKAIESPIYRVEVFLASELIVNVTQHHLVPVHQLLTDEEKKAVLEEYKVKETQMPRILVTDAIARYYGFQPGQVVKIIRAGENAAGTDVAYRYVSLGSS